jgi:hypothetical protein
MVNIWDIYNKSLKNIYYNEIIFMKMIMYYYTIIIKNKVNDQNYIKNNYNITEAKFELFNEYILKQKNIGIFTIFNNVPDILHPLESNVYLNYGSYISFIDPNYFQLKDDDITILKENILNVNHFKYPLTYQNVAPYNKHKRHLYINIKYYDHEDYKKYILLKVDSDKNIYSYHNNILKKKIDENWTTVESALLKNYKWIYVGILRKMNKTDFLNIFNVSKTIKKDTLIYSNHNSDNKSIDKIYFYGLNKNHNLHDPFLVKNHPIYQYVFKMKKTINVINLACDILSNNKLSKTISIDKLIEDTLINENIVYNGNLNYLTHYDDPEKIFFHNNSKRLFYEILYKSSQFINKDFSYFKILNSQYNINEFINTYGYYDKYNRIFDYEFGIFNPDKKILEFDKIIEKPAPKIDDLIN